MVQTMAKLRTIKVNSNDERITPMTELAFIPRKTNGQYPGLFIFTGASRYVQWQSGLENFKKVQAKKLVKSNKSK